MFLITSQPGKFCINCVRLYFSIYEQLEKAIRPQTEEERLQIYDAASLLFPKMDSPKIIPLKFVKGIANCLISCFSLGTITTPYIVEHLSLDWIVVRTTIFLKLL